MERWREALLKPGNTLSGGRRPAGPTRVTPMAHVFEGKLTGFQEEGLAFAA